MDIIGFSLHKPVTVLVGVILILLFGLIGLSRMPYQLSPTVTEPEITVTTNWTGATPYEVERDIIEEQENVLKGIPGLIEMESSSRNSAGTITLKFKIGTDVDDALLRVSNKLNEVRSYPQNVDNPVINATGAATSPVIWMVLKAREDNPESIYNYLTFFKNEVRQYLERVEGVADLFIGGGRDKEMHVIIDPDRLASYGITMSDFIRALQAENINVSAGTMDVGRRNYRIRTVAEVSSPEEITEIVIRSTGQQRIKVSDVARVEFGYTKFVTAMMHNNKEGIAVGIKPEPGTNILDLTSRMEEVVGWLNQQKLKDENVYLDWVYDQRPYINSAIGLVKKNILIGGILAISVLLIFLRSISSTLTVGFSIPISIIGTFIVMNGFGRNLNVVSLAGIAFAVGMLVDNSIVVIENIDRHRKLGKKPFTAAYDGAREVWGAVFASTLTTVAVFLPVVFIEEEAGQLFRDIAIAVTAAVTLSLFVSVSVIPMLSKFFFSRSKRKARNNPGSWIARTGQTLGDFLMFLVGIAQKNWATRLFTVVLWITVSILASIALLPKMEYLPQGNRNLVINILIPPPGLSYQERYDIGRHIFQVNEPYMGKSHKGFPGIENMFYVGSEAIMLFGAVSTEAERAGELVPLFMPLVNSIPGMFGVSNQAGIFQTGLGKGRTIDVDISSNDLNKTVQVGGAMFGSLMQAIPGSQIRPVPSLELLYPEVRIIPDRERLRAAGLNAQEFGVLLDVLMDGREIGEFKQEGEKKIDLILKGGDQLITTPEDLYESMLRTPSGMVLPVSSLGRKVETTGITEIRHLERQRTVTLQITPPGDLPLEQAMETIQNETVPQLRDQGMLDGVDVTLSGTADKLTETRLAMQWNFVLAAVIIYLLMSALFANFIYPLVILFTIPMAGAGGFIGLKLVNLFITPQPLDILTMLGFVILIGVVVNNAILIVHQSLNNIRYEGMGYAEAVQESTRTRLRPIFMSATTSIFGMLPLVLAPGAGSELYRGLGSVVLGGLAFSTMLTVFVIPCLLMFFIKSETEKKQEDTAGPAS